MNNQTPRASVISHRKGEMFEVRFDGFADLPAIKGVDFVDSPEFLCFGHKWILQVYPGGHISSPDGMVAIFLRIESDEIPEVSETAFTVEKTCTFEEKATRVVASTRLESHIDGWGTSLFAERSVLLDSLQQGSLVIKVEIRQPNCSSGGHPFVPENPILKNIMKKFNHEESSDVVFEVSGCGTEDESEEPTKFYAHTWILEDGAPTLFDLTGSDDGSDTSMTRIPITDVEPSIFECLLSYVYGGKVESGNLKDNAKAYIDAADKYNVVNLKLEAEAALVSTTVITIDNVLEFLLYADEKNRCLVT